MDIKIKTGTDFSGIGALDQALKRLRIKQDKKFACDMDKYARQTYILNYGEPEYYPENVYEREIPEESLDLYVTTPPCQGFSLAGLRKGSILFLNSHGFIRKNKPRFFMFENVKGLLSHDKRNKKQIYGNTFNEWLNYLGGKSVNGNPVIFPHENSVPYHIYHTVLNAKHYGIPQNRERVFIVGIRDDVDNDFRWPKPMPLVKRLKDVLEKDVDEKYYLSDKMLKGFLKHAERHNENGNGFGFSPSDISKESKSITTKPGSRNTDNYIKEGFINQDTQASQVVSDEGISSTLTAGTHGYANGYVKVKSATKKGYEIATEGDSINLEFPDSETRRGRVGKGVAQTLDTGCNQGVVQLNESKESNNSQPYKQNRVYDSKGVSPTLDTECGRPNFLMNDYKIRRLTPLECFRLMDFNESFKWDVSDTQAYKQAGNSIPVGLLAGIVKNLNL